MRPLLEGLAAEYERLYGEKAANELSSREVTDFLAPHGAFLLLTADGDVLAGGGLAPLGPGVAEVKRMWTAPAHRRRGHAQRILAALEDEARALGYRTVRLQTGRVAQPAIALYRAAGYAEIPPFGPYRDEPLALGFEKRL